MARVALREYANLNVNNNRQKPEENYGTEDHLPPVGEPVWVLCEGYRCMAFRDAEGKWRNLATREELVGVKQVIQPD